MINNAAGDNVILSVEQQNSINLVERRLLKLRDEIGDAKVESKQLTEEVDKISKAKDYQDKLLKGLEIEVAGLEERKKILDKEIKDGNKKQKDLVEKNTLVEEDLVNRTKVLKDKEEKFAVKEIEFNKSVADFNSKSAQLERDILATSEAKKILADAISKI